MNVLNISLKVAAAVGLTIALAAGAALSPAAAPQAAAAQISANQKATSWLNNPAFKQSGQLYVPLRETAGLFDLHLAYNHSSKEVELTGITRFAKLKSGSSKAEGINGTSLSLGAPVIIKQGVTYVPASLFSKLFGIPITYISKNEISYVYTSKYVLAQTNGVLFWMNRSQGVLYMGSSAKLPTKVGTVTMKHPDLLGMTAVKIDDSTYVVNIHNNYGEPHIFNGRYRVLLHNGQILRQSSMYYGGPSLVYLEEDVLQFDGKIILNDGVTAELVTPDGQVAETLNLDQYGGPDDVYSLEAIESDFLLIRSYAAGTLLLVDRSTGKTTPIYLSLLDEASIDRIKNDDMGIGDGLTYIGRSGNQLKFSWRLYGKGGEPETKVYELN